MTDSFRSAPKPKRSQYERTVVNIKLYVDRFHRIAPNHLVTHFFSLSSLCRAYNPNLFNALVSLSLLGAWVSPQPQRAPTLLRFQSTTDGLSF